jgi:putative PIN family toxin of toxin-antitoxin system
MPPEARLRVLIDTNVLVSAVTNGGVPERVVDMARSGSVTGLVSLHILAEFREVLMRPRFSVDVTVVDALVEQIAGFCDVVAVERAIGTWSADPDDDPVVEAAIRGRANVLVTGDRHLLALTVPGLRIARPAEIVEELG